LGWLVERGRGATSGCQVVVADAAGMPARPGCRLGTVW
jgi:hypothetical protein